MSVLYSQFDISRDTCVEEDLHWVPQREGQFLPSSICHNILSELPDKKDLNFTFLCV